MEKIKIAILTISDTCHENPKKDCSGPHLIQLVKANFPQTKIHYEILPDEKEIIVDKLQELCNDKRKQMAIVFTTGGTGFARRDVTPEATRQVLDKECPQLTIALTMFGLKKTKYAALSRGVCGIAKNTLIINMPGSVKAVGENFEYIKDLLPHAMALIDNDLVLVSKIHEQVKSKTTTAVVSDATAESIAEPNQSRSLRHQCPHKERHSTYELIAYDRALEIIKRQVVQEDTVKQMLTNFKSPINVPAFRASIKDGYAMKSSGLPGIKKVLGRIQAGDIIITQPIEDDECYRINTGAPVPRNADCVIQIEDTKLIKTKRNGDEELVEILVEPMTNLDIREIGCDLSEESLVFEPYVDMSPVVVKSLMAAVGYKMADICTPTIAIVSTGNELLQPGETGPYNKIYDSNTTLLQELLQYFGFRVHQTLVLDDDFDNLYMNFKKLYQEVDFIICTGGVSMGDRDFIKPVLEKMNFQIHFGRVNIKPGKPMTFASSTIQNEYFFGLPGNPTSAFVTFHLFALPALRWWSGVDFPKCILPIINVKLDNAKIQLDARPEFMRATITSRNGELFATITGSQMSSRLQSIIGADVLLHLPPACTTKNVVVKGEILSASVLRYDFVTKYE